MVGSIIKTKHLPEKDRVIQITEAECKRLKRSAATYIETLQFIIYKTKFVTRLFMTIYNYIKFS